MASIPDNTSVGVEILKVKVTDLDEAHNAEIIFSLLGAEGKFIINQTTGASFFDPGLNLPIFLN